MEAGNYRLRSSAKALQSLAGARIDLQIAEDMLRHCIEPGGAMRSACSELEEACWTTAIVRYERCFSGRSWPTKEVVTDRLSGPQLEAHHYFRYLRDKMFSHAVGVGEDFEITAAVFFGASKGLEIVAVGARPRRISSPGSDLAYEFLELVKVVRGLVDPFYELLRNQLRDELRGMPLSEVIRGGPVRQVDLSLGKSDPGFRHYLERALK